MTHAIEIPEGIPETPLPDVKPVRGRFEKGATLKVLQDFYTPEQIETMREAGVDKRMMFGINPYYNALVQGTGFTDDTGKVLLPEMPPSEPLKNLVIPILSEAADLAGQADPSSQQSYSPERLKGKVLHKYDEIVLGYVALACSAHCRYCYRLDLFNGDTGKSLVKPEELRDYVADYNKELKEREGIDPATGEPRYPIREVLLSGGDPMVLGNKKLYAYMAAAAEAGVDLVRIGTKELSFRPMRFDDNLINMLEVFHQQYPDAHVNFVVHFSHPDEFLQRDWDNNHIRNRDGYRWIEAVDEAVQRLNALPFVSIENQNPIIAGVNDDPAALHLMHEELRRNGIKPKYTFQCREIEGHSAFAVPLEEAWKIHNESQKGLSDTSRSRFAMSTKWGKLEVVSVIDGIPEAALETLPVDSRETVKEMLGDGLVLLKAHRSPFSADTQGDLIVARRNPAATWISDYEDRLLYDGRKKGAEKFTALAEALNAAVRDDKAANALTQTALAEKPREELLEFAPEQFHTAYDVARILNGRGAKTSARAVDAAMRKLEKSQDEEQVVLRALPMEGSSRGAMVVHLSDVPRVQQAVEEQQRRQIGR